jgi:hypothetical protein
MAVTTTSFPTLDLVAKGKVRDLYSIPSDPSSLLFFSTDRVPPIPFIQADCRFPPTMSSSITYAQLEIALTA